MTESPMEHLAFAHYASRVDPRRYLEMTYGVRRLATPPFTCPRLGIGSVEPWPDPPPTVTTNSTGPVYWYPLRVIGGLPPKRRPRWRRYHRRSES